MIDPDNLGKVLKDLNFSFFTGKPSISNANLYNLFEHRFGLFNAVSTKEAFSLAAGAALAGKKPIVVIDELSLLSSLNILELVTTPYNLPFLGFLVVEDLERPLKNHIEEDLLLHKIKTKKLQDDTPLKDQITDAKEYIEKTEKSLIFLVQQSLLLEMPIKETIHLSPKLPILIRKNKGKEESTLTNSVEYLLRQTSQDYNIFTADPIIAKVLENYERPIKHLFLKSVDTNPLATALGYTLANKKPVVCLDTHTTLLSHLSSVATTGHFCPSSFLHIVFDDHTYSSIGGQRSISNSGDYAAMAHALGYEISFSMDCKNELAKLFLNWKNDQESTFVHIKVKAEKDRSTPQLYSNSPLEKKETFLKTV